MAASCPDDEHGRWFAITVALAGFLATGHALWSLPIPAALALVAGGVSFAILGEAVVIRWGWLCHRIEPQIAGIPLHVPLGWVAAIYPAFWLALVVTDGVWAAILGAAIATVMDGFTDHRGVAREYWRYPPGSPGPRFRSVPLWNFLGWFVVALATMGLTVAFL